MIFLQYILLYYNYDNKDKFTIKKINNIKSKNFKCFILLFKNNWERMIFLFKLISLKSYWFFFFETLLFLKLNKFLNRHRVSKKNSLRLCLVKEKMKRNKRKFKFVLTVVRGKFKSFWKFSFFPLVFPSTKQGINLYLKLNW